MVKRDTNGTASTHNHNIIRSLLLCNVLNIHRCFKHFENKISFEKLVF